MGLSSVLAAGIKTMKATLKDLLVEVTLETYAGDQDDDEKVAGERTYSTGVTYQVALMSKTKFVKIDEGLQPVIITAVQFLDPVLITELDRITLPSGEQPQIVSVQGFKRRDGLFFAPKVQF